MRQFFAAKASHPDAILFFRLGDFYEMFLDDAVLAARLLELTLTSRNKGAPDEIPMCGVPYHAAHGYVAKLLAAGHKVALCEQMADPAKTRGIVPREVVRVLTPALVTDGEHLEARENAFLAAVDVGAQTGLALLDLSTGELSATTLESGAAVVAELARARPREVLLGGADAALRAAIVQAARGVALRDDPPLVAGTEDAELSRALSPEAIVAARGEVAAPGLRAAARAIRFAAECSPATPVPVRRIEAWSVEDTLLLDEVAQRHLELVVGPDGGKRGTLLSLIDETRTPGGARLLRRRLLAPLRDVARIRRRLDSVELFVTHAAVRSELREALSRITDVERLAVRAQLGEATPRDLGALRDALGAVPDVARALASIPEPSAVEVLGLDREPLDGLPELHERLARAFVDRPPALAREGGFLRQGYDAALDEARELEQRGTERLSALEARLREETGATTLKVKFTRVFGWYIEVTGKHLSKVPTAWRRKQTVAGAERYTNDELDELSDRILHAEERARELETDLFRALVTTTAAESRRLSRLAVRLAEWDVHAALADVAHRFDYARPDIDAGTALELENARHPVVERLAAAGTFVPNDVALDADGERLWLVTGPNMAGKSTLMRQVALAVILAQMGSFVPATRARVGVVDRILSRVGASDDLSRGESTFMVEMRETSSILRAATRRSLVILDEIGRGTSTYDGLAIAWAVAEHLHDACGCRALFATHYHELTELPKLLPAAANTSVSARELGDDIVFLHKLQRGAASRSYGLAVARLAGLPEPVLARAKAILGALEGGGTLPSGGHANLRARGKSGHAQLDLFAAPAAEVPTSHPALELLRALDPDRLTPLEALGLIAKLKSLT
jgi:DNA mismatch repair protein MutS